MADEHVEGSPNVYDLSKPPFDPDNIPRGPFERLRNAVTAKRGGPSRRALLLGALTAFGAGAAAEATIDGKEGPVRLVDRMAGPPTEITGTEIHSCKRFEMLAVNDSIEVQPLETFPPFFTKAERNIVMKGGKSESELLKPWKEQPTPEQEPAPVLIGAKAPDGREVTTLTELTLPENLSECGTLIELREHDMVYVATRGSSKPLSVTLTPVEGVENRKGSQICMMQVSNDSGNFPPLSSVYVAINTFNPEDKPIEV